MSGDAAAPPAAAATTTAAKAVSATTAAAATTNTAAPQTAASGSKAEVVAHSAASQSEATAKKDTPTVVVPSPPRRSAFGRVVRAFGMLLLLAATGAAAFYVGMFYQKRQAAATAPADTAPPPVSTQQEAPPDPEAQFEKQRREVDKAPIRMAKEMAAQNGGSPLDSTDAQFLYLYGRALMLSGKPAEAAEAFKRAIEKIKERPSRDPLKVEAKLSSAVAALKTGNWATAQKAAKELDEVIETENKSETVVALPGNSNTASTTSGAGNP
jgi:tetratricopeptide (TPR) repeat protein